MTKTMRATSTLLISALTSLAAPSAQAAWALNMTQGVSDISRRIYSLHMIMLWVCVVIGVIVFGVMIYSIVAFRKSQGAVPDTTLTHSTKVEAVWTVIPVLILIGSAVPAARTLIETENATNTEMTIVATGYQWKWGYEYRDSGVSFFSTLDRDSNVTRQLGSGRDPNSVPDYLLNVDNALVVPAGVKIRLLLTSQDVIHAWWLPAVGVKKDAIPGLTNVAWFKVDADKVGIYRGQCAELCGRDHGFMPIVLDVRSKADFDQWMAEKKAAAQPAAQPTTATAPSTATVPQAG
jgi:cytochrome c oxidase subunit 2